MKNPTLKSLGDAAAGFCTCFWLIAAVFGDQWGAWLMLIAFVGLMIYRAIPNED